MKKDFLIVGQGLAGSLLTWELMQRGYSVGLIDNNSQNTSSKKAAGLYNPITGREMKKTWMADELFAVVESHYKELEEQIDEKFLYSKSIYRPFHAVSEQNDWLAKYRDRTYENFIEDVVPSLNIDALKDSYGGLLLKNSGYLDLPKMLSTFRKSFEQMGVLWTQEFTEGMAFDLAQRVIFCEGTYVSTNHYWKTLPFRPVRGEILDIKCDLPIDKIYNRGVFVLPKEGYFRVGSTYDHQTLSFTPQEKGIAELKQRFAKLYTGSYEIIDASAGLRPATHDRRPYIGWHTENKSIGIFNGFGAKGVSLVPYFSKLFVDSIERKAVIPSEANVSRVL